MITEEKQVKAGLIAGGFTALLASVCCLGPLVLVLLGIGGAWVSTLGLLYPVKPYLIVGTYLLLAWNGYQLYRPKKSCAIGSLCANPRYQKILRITFWFVLCSASIVFLLPEVLPYFLLN